MKKMNQKIKKKWVKALRSGKYKQGTEALKFTYDGEAEFCCLGVLCDIVGDKVSIKQNLDIPRNSTLKKVGLPTVDKHDPFYDSDSVVVKLARFNDGGMSFNWIASYIDRYL